MSTEEFVRRKNIERYRQMLESANLASDERVTISRLLAEEERRETEDCPGSGHVSRGISARPHKS